MLGSVDKLREMQGMYETMERLRNIPPETIREEVLVQEVRTQSHFYKRKRNREVPLEFARSVLILSAVFRWSLCLWLRPLLRGSAVFRCGSGGNLVESWLTNRVGVCMAHGPSSSRNTGLLQSALVAACHSWAVTSLPLDPYVRHQASCHFMALESPRCRFTHRIRRALILAALARI